MNHDEELRKYFYDRMDTAERLLISVVLFKYYRDTEAIKEALKSINCNTN